SWESNWWNWMPGQAIVWLLPPPRSGPFTSHQLSSTRSRTCPSGWRKSTRTAANSNNRPSVRSAETPSMARATVSAKAPLTLICGDDEFAVKQRAKQIYQKWSGEIGGMDHEILDAQVTNSGEALRVLGRLRAALQTLPFFGTGKVVWLQSCTFLGDERTASAQAVTEFLAELSQELKEFEWGNVRLLISAGKVDKRKTFFKTVEKLGSIENFAAWSLDD